MRVMGLDASTTTVGIAIIDDKDDCFHLVYLNHYSPHDFGESELDRLRNTKAHVLSLIDGYSVDQLAIEEFIQFLKGGSGAKTIIPLALMNRTLCLGYYEKYNKLPDILSVLKIRHTLKRSKQLPKKEDMPDLVASYLAIDFPWIEKINRKKEVVKIPENYDRADAIAVALTSLYEYRRSIESVGVKPRSKSRGSSKSLPKKGSRIASRQK